MHSKNLYIYMYVHTRIGTYDDCVHSSTPFNQYSPFFSETLQSLVSCCLICLQEIAFSGDNL